MEIETVISSYALIKYLTTIISNIIKIDHTGCMILSGNFHLSNLIPRSIIREEL